MGKVQLVTDYFEKIRISQKLQALGFPRKVTDDYFILNFESKGFLIGILNRTATGFLSYFFVEEQYRNQGIGSSLIEAFVSYAKEKGLNRLIIPGSTGDAPGYIQPGINLETERSALTLVKQMGFEELGRVFSMKRSLENDIKLPLNSEWDVREPNFNDRALIADAIANSVPGEWSNIFDERLKTSPNEMLVVLHSNIVVAYSSWSQDRFGPIGVRPEYRGKGLGKHLLAHSLGKMKEMGCRQAWFSWSDEENLHFYQSFDFEITSSFARLALDLS
jgi:GNAT superfamily N-acetyltransferase